MSKRTNVPLADRPAVKTVLGSWFAVACGKAPRSQQALDDYDVRTLFVWLPVSVAYLTVIVLQLLSPDSQAAWFNGFYWLMSGLFLIDYLIRLRIAPARWVFVSRPWNIADLVVIATPVLGTFLPPGWSGLLRLLRLVRLVRIAARIWNSGRRASRRGQVKWVLVIAGAVFVVAWMAAWVAESGRPGSYIHTPADALWWAIVTMFTVGFNKMYPYTIVGKVAAVALMVSAVALFGWLTATLASLFVESGNEKEARRQRDRLEEQLHQVRDELRLVHKALAGLAGEREEAAAAAVETRVAAGDDPLGGGAAGPPPGSS